MYSVPLGGIHGRGRPACSAAAAGNFDRARKLGGVNSPSLRALRIRSRHSACSSAGMYGFTSFSVRACRAKGGGLVGKGCVGHDCSPGTSDFGTGRSSTGQIGWPVRRSSTNRNPCLVGWITTSTFLPSCFTVRSLGRRADRNPTGRDERSGNATAACRCGRPARWSNWQTDSGRSGRRRNNPIFRCRWE